MMGICDGRVTWCGELVVSSGYFEGSLTCGI